MFGCNKGLSGLFLQSFKQKGSSCLTVCSLIIIRRIWQDLVLPVRLRQRVWLCGSVCTGIYSHSLHLCTNYSLRGVTDRGFYQDKLAPKSISLSLSTSKGLEQFQTSLSAVFYERYLHSGPAFACAL